MVGSSWNLSLTQEPVRLGTIVGPGKHQIAMIILRSLFLPTAEIYGALLPSRARDRILFEHLKNHGSLLLLTNWPFWAMQKVHTNTPDMRG